MKKRENSKLLSILVPTYNCENYVEEGLDSILNQLPKNCELVVVDDGSTDGTVEKLRKYEKAKLEEKSFNCEKLKIIFAQHLGVSGGRNIALDNASGEYITFMDCDDCLQPDFLLKSIPLLEKKASLYIFGIERITLDGKNEIWSVKDNFYPTIYSFADNYIRKKNLMIYSNCNKFYRTDVIENFKLRFEQNLSFGEDRLFNFQYLKALKMSETSFNGIITSSIIQLRYLQRSLDSQSTKYVLNYFDIAYRLHKKKMECILSLSKKANDVEKKKFESSDLAREVIRTADRFKEHPEEILENLEKLNEIVFGSYSEWNEKPDVLIILGSEKCEYRAETGLFLWLKYRDVPIVVSGGNKTSFYGTEEYEADYIEKYLLEHGIPKKYIHNEKNSTNTRENLIHVNNILQEFLDDGIKIDNIGIVTAGFHVNRSKKIADEAITVPHKKIIFYPAYSQNIKPWNWFMLDETKEIIMNELSKI